MGKRRLGSGVYVTHLELPASEGSADAFAGNCLEEGLQRGFPPETLSQEFAKLIHQAAPGYFLVVDADLHLAHILATEIGEALNCHAVLIAVVSSSASVRRWASTLLSALGFSADSVLLRDPGQPGPAR
jgi:hypothetical protein